MDREEVLRLVAPFMFRPLRTVDKHTHEANRGEWPYVFIIRGVRQSGDSFRSVVMIDIMWQYAPGSRNLSDDDVWRSTSVAFKDYVFEGVNDA